MRNFAMELGRSQGGLFTASWRKAMEDAIAEIESALVALEKPDPLGSRYQGE